MDALTGIYCIENRINHKKYVGQSQDIKKRWACHRHQLEQGIHPNEHLQKSWNKYGGESFAFYVLELCDSALLSQREIYYIAECDSFEYGYNKTLGGEGTRGVLHSDEYKAHMREIFTGRTFSEGTLEKMSQAKKGKPLPERDPDKVAAGYKAVSEKLKGRSFSDEHKQHLSEALKGRKAWNKGKNFPPEASPMYGKHHSDETKEKISKANSGKVKTPETRAKISKRVVCIETEEVFPSITAAAERYGVTIYAISNVLRGKSSTCKKLHWRYAEGSGMS